MTIEENKALLEKYPFFLPHLNDGDIYDFSYTWVDYFPLGWWKAFGEELCDDIVKQAKEDGVDLKNIIIYDIKEKFGELRFDCDCTTNIQRIIDKYACLSRHICIKCGRLNVPRTVKWRWIMPICKNCFENNLPYRVKDKYDDVVDLDSSNINKQLTIKSFSNKESSIITYDLSDIIKRLEEKTNGHR